MYVRISATVCALALAIFFAASAPPVAAEKPKLLYWEDLVPKASAIKRPYGKLSEEVLKDLEAILWVEAQLKQGKIEKRDPTYQLAMGLRKNLVEKGIDVDRLIREVDKLRSALRQLRMTVVKDLDGKIVRMPGYALPLEFSNKGITEFLLVPYVGACIHVPPPPPNQMIFVTTDRPFKLKGLYDPVYVTGRLSTKSASRKLNFVDGVRAVETGYALKASAIERYRKK